MCRPTIDISQKDRRYLTSVAVLGAERLQMLNLSSRPRSERAADAYK